MQTRTILIAGITAASFATPALAEYVTPSSPGVVVPSPPPVAQAPAPVVAGPAYPVPVPPAPCFWQGRAFSSGSTNPPGEVCAKGRWQ
jgi:hypothetical protein